ncbi:hypothetical protein MMP61_19260 [Acinetobacter sp. NIPH 1958]|uniref:phage tail tube protein n=1 Tax=Acinetobacter sp. NIPH 1958 TaxID=2923430 RepID=UPI001F4B214E|nr:phage tail tube protein [Acinetobacter sp. NIPH 1958]MCH7357671.1 hypothetical protein [Acinetobacter sp. NIPH 1958]
MAQTKANGTHVYAFDGTTLTRALCLTTIDLGSDSTTRLETTCLDDTDAKTYITGLSDPGQGSLGWAYDAENASQIQLIEWAQDKKQGLQFYIGGSESADAPTVTGSNVTLPTTRSWWSFQASVSTPSPTFEADALVMYTIALERSTPLINAPKT